MEEFLIIAPEGWTQFDYEGLINSGTITVDIKDILGSPGQVTEILTTAGVLLNGEYVNEAKVIDDRFMWLKLG